MLRGRLKTIPFFIIYIHKELFMDMDKNEILASPKGKAMERYIRIHYPNEYPLVLKCTGGRWAEKLYNYLFNSPGHKCVVCGKPTTFSSITKGYKQYCCPRCVRLGTKEGTEKKMIKKYGVPNASQSKEVKERKKQTMISNFGSLENAYKEREKKTKSTCLEKYGVENASQSEEIKERKKQTMISNFGSLENAYKEVSDKRAQTNMERYGTSYPSQSREVKERARKTNHESGKELELKLYIKSLGFDGNRTRTVLPSGKELDIYIPEKKIAIEFNGIYFHSDMFKTKDYHINKFEECRQQGIQLLQIWEDWMINKPRIVKSIIKAKLGVFDHRVYARKCEIKMVPPKESRVFMNENHIQGASGASYHYGLYYEGGLISLMTFGKRRPGMGGKKQIDGQYELIRFCNRQGWQVVMGAERLLKHFIKDVHPKSIISYSSNDISDGNLYMKLGFEQARSISPGYWYLDQQMRRYHRYEFNKYQIVKKGLVSKDLDPKYWTERMVMDAAGYYRIYDSGTTRWELSL